MLIAEAVKAKRITDAIIHLTSNDTVTIRGDMDVVLCAGDILTYYDVYYDHMVSMQNCENVPYRPVLIEHED